MGALVVGTLPNRPQRPTSSRPLLVPPAQPPCGHSPMLLPAPAAEPFALKRKEVGFHGPLASKEASFPGDSALALPSSLPVAQGARPGPGQPVGQRAPIQWVQGGPWAAGSGSKPGPWPWPQRCAGHRVAAPWALETDDGGESTVLPPRCELSTAQCRL